MKLYKFLIKPIIFCGLVVLVAEGLLRAGFALSTDNVTKDMWRFGEKIRTRIFGEWMDTTQTDLMRPPFLVYSDAGADNAERLREIFERTRLPPSTTWQTFDFLQDPARRAQTTYTVHSNFLGFRGVERQAEKPAHTVRIIALGSYHTFGEGLNEEQTYPEILEKQLNANGPGKTYEVWNGGRLASTAIVGLARLEHEIFDYKPDLLIFDYGFVDTLVWGDNWMPRAMRLPDSGLYYAIKKIVHPFVPIISNSLLFGRVMNFYYDLQKSRVDAHTEHFKFVLRRMMAMAEAQHVPVILVRQFNAGIHPRVYLDLAKQFPGTSFLSVEAMFEKRPIAAGWSDRDASATWLSEFEFPETWHQSIAFRYYSYRLNFYQLNEAGQKILAEGLRTLIQGRYQNGDQAP